MSGGSPGTNVCLCLGHKDVRRESGHQCVLVLRAQRCQERVRDTNVCLCLGHKDVRRESGTPMCACARA